MMRPTTARTAALAIAALTAVACAAVGEPAPAGPPPFQGVRSIALVRLRSDPSAARPKDTLDALAEGLAARGYATRVVELGRELPDELREVERLRARVEGRIEAAAIGGPRRRAEPLGAASAEAVRGLRVDAVAMYHRFEDRLPSFAGPFPGERDLPRRRELSRRPAGALSLVDRDGNAMAVGWGGAGAELDPSAAVNAAEAIDLLLRALAGEAEE